MFCKEKNIKGYSGKTKDELINLLMLQNTSDIPETQNNQTDEYVYQTMLTCIGNKRKLVKSIRNIVEEIRVLLKKDKLNIVDGFAGSSVVSRELSYIADNIYTNDLECYAYLMAYCYLVNPESEQKEKIKNHIKKMNDIAEKGPFFEGIISKLYAPKDTNNIKEGERCFYTRENALIIDTLRKYIEDNVEEDIKNYCLVPLLNKSSIHTNTAGVFKGFYKKGNLGWFGGKGEFALSRIKKPIRLDIPIWNNSTYKAHPSNKDINTLISQLPNNIDIMYLDPPYNQHPYGSNYFMLNVIAKNEEPLELSKVSGIPSNWNKSNYNSHSSAIKSMKELMKIGLQKSKYLLISYNNEGIITDDDWKKLFTPFNVKKYEINYDTFKGCRNLKERDNKVVEIMYLISKKEDIVKLLTDTSTPTHNEIVIETSTKSNSQKLNMIDLFAGTGAFTLAFQLTNNVNVVFGNDMVEHSKKIYDENFNHKLTLKDLNEVKVEDIPSHHILTGGFPCQPFSIAGLQEGFKDERSNVFWKILSIIDYHQPKCVILENVKNIVSHDENKTFTTIKENLQKRGYYVSYKVLNTAEITGIPQHRERIYIVCVKSKKVFDKFSLDFPKIEKKPISNFLESSVADKYYYTDKTTTWTLVKNNVVKKNTIYQYRRVYVRENKSSECPTLTANMGGGGHNVPIILDDKGIRKLTPRECFNFQGFPSSYKLPKLSDSSLYKLAGNAVSVPVVKLIANRIIPLLQED